MGYPPKTPFGITKAGIKGLDKPKVRSGNQLVAQGPGAWPGTNQLNTRTIDISFDIAPPFGDYGNLYGALAALRDACSTEGSDEYPLWVRIPGSPVVCSYARVTRSNRPWDLGADLGSIVQNSPIEWEATDPYLYGAPTNSATVGLAQPSGGMVFPLTFPWSFGGAITPNEIACTNNGDVPCWPVLVITGPCIDPSVVAHGVPNSPTLRLGMQLQSGDKLVVDCRTGSILFFPNGGTVGTPVQNILDSGSSMPVEVALPPGVSYLSFDSQDTLAAAGTLTAWWADTYSGLI